MEPAQGAELMIGLLGAMAVLAVLARWLSLPYPVLFVVGGLALAVAPNLPTVAVPPDLVFLVFVPPLIYSAGALTSLREIRANALAIALLAIGLVLATTVAVAAVARAVVPELPWLTALALGAMLSPTDASAAIARRLHLPRSVVALMEGESLFNHATALVFYQAAVAAAFAGSSSLTDTLTESAPHLVLAVLGGIAVGLAIGWLSAWVRRLSHVVDDPLIDVSVSLLTPYAAWIIAEGAHISGALAVVVAGAYAGRTLLSRLAPSTRVQDMGFWQVLVFILEGLLFVLVGLQLREVLTAVGAAVLPLVLPALALSLTVVALRVGWVLLTVRLSRHTPSAQGQRVEGWREALAVAWAGTRGGVSLAAALSLPLTMPNGQGFPGRGDAVFLAFAVILTTLLLQGPTLPKLVHLLGVVGDEETDREELMAREEIAHTALGRVGELADREDVPDPAADQVRHDLERDVRETRGELDEGQRAHVEAERRLRREALVVQRDQVIKLRDQGVVTDEVLRRIERELDLEELSLEDAPAREV